MVMLEERNEILTKEEVPENSCVRVTIEKVDVVELNSTKTNKPFRSFVIQCKYNNEDKAIWTFESEIRELGKAWGDTDNWKGKIAEFWRHNNTKNMPRWKGVPTK